MVERPSASPEARSGLNPATACHAGFLMALIYDVVGLRFRRERRRHFSRIAKARITALVLHAHPRLRFTSTA